MLTEDRAATPHSLAMADLADVLATDEQDGITTIEVQRRRSSFGPNEAPSPEKDHTIRRALKHLREPMALLLIGAAIVSGAVLREIPEALAIAAIVVLNVAIAIVQESRAERALEALKDLESPGARVIRDGRATEIAAADLVPGDVVLLAEGDRVPADVRLTETAWVSVDESSLTGESLPVRKDALVDLPPSTPVADRTNMAFSSTLVTAGSGRGVVAATGDRTEIGKIAASLRSQKPITPLQRELARLTGRLGLLAVLAAATTFAFSALWKGLDPEAIQHSFLAAVALAVAAVPEGLATVVAVALALGVKRMAGEGAIVRSLPAVETLGSTTVIATDKTGTLTFNDLEVIEVWIPELERDAHLVCALCNDASLTPASGDPLEIALLRWLGPEVVDDLRQRYDIVARHPFDSARKRMAVLVRRGSERSLLVKGAPEAVLDVSTQDVDATEVHRQIEIYAARGLKVLALAHRDDPPSDDERELKFIGLIALGDALRPEARSACREASEAGLKVIMVTGDHPRTASAIAQAAGLGSTVMTSDELAAGGFPSDPATVDIYARVTPQQKLDLVEALKRRGHVVAVGGDGVNDAPALHQAHIGVAMGRRGTDVAREAADLVITDDNLNTIVSAIREGRVIYDNIRKVVEYLVAANLAEVMTFVSCLVLFPGLGVPLLPLQLLWINLITDGLPAIGLGLDPAATSVMKRPPRRARDPLIGRPLLGKLARRGTLLAVSCVAALAIAHFTLEQPWPHARGLLFTTLAIAQLFYAFVVRGPLRNPLSNRWLLAGVGGGFGLQILLIAWRPLRELFGAAWLSPREWLLALTAALLPAIVMTLTELPSKDRPTASTQRKPLPTGR